MTEQELFEVIESFPISDLKKGIDVQDFLKAWKEFKQKYEDLVNKSQTIYIQDQIDLTTNGFSPSFEPDYRDQWKYNVCPSVDNN